MSKRDAGPRKDATNGTWWFVVDVGAGPDGRRRQAKRRGFPTKKAAQEEFDRLRVKVHEHAYVAPKRQTFAEFVTDDWLPAIRTRLQESTVESYERNLRLHVLPAIGSTQLQHLDASQLNRLYADLQSAPRLDGRPGQLRQRTVKYIATIIHKVLKDAVRWDRVQHNVADKADPPSAEKAKPPEMQTWSREELGRFLELVKGNRYHAPFLFLATTGCRRGEALGLRWSDLDLPKSDDERRGGRASIRQTVTTVRHRIRIAPRTKTGKARQIELDERTVSTLRAWRAQHAAERLAMGDGYEDHGLVFCHPDGRP